MACDTKRGWCSCGRFHNAKEKMKPKKKVRAIREKKIKPLPEHPKPPEEPEEIRYPFGAPRIW